VGLNVKAARENVIDPDELQLMDECNRVWVRRWIEATKDSDVIRVVAVAHKISKKMAPAPKIPIY
jgi:hypothetical protein